MWLYKLLSSSTTCAGLRDEPVQIPPLISMETWGFVSFGISIFSGELASITAPASKTKRKNCKHSLEEQQPGRQPRHGRRADARNHCGLSYFVNNQLYLQQKKKKSNLKYPPISVNPIGGKEGAIKLGNMVDLGACCTLPYGWRNNVNPWQSVND